MLCIVGYVVASFLFNVSFPNLGLRIGIFRVAERREGAGAGTRRLRILSEEKGFRAWAVQASLLGFVVRKAPPKTKPKTAGPRGFLYECVQ